MSRSIILLFLVFCFPVYAQNTPHVLVTIKPVHSLVTSLLLNITQPSLLLDGARSPHDYQLRPSDAHKIATADVVIWVGPTLESFMQKQVNKISSKRLIQLTDNGSKPGAHGHLNEDPHRWLDPQLAILDSQRIAKELTMALPQFKRAIAHNLQQLTSRLRSLDKELDQMFVSKRRVSAVLYHDAWQYFTKRFQLDVHGVINPSAHQQPGARHLGELMQTIESRSTRCLLMEPQFKPRYLKNLQDKRQLSVFNVDPLGAKQTAGANAYFDMMRANAQAFAKCR